MKKLLFALVLSLGLGTVNTADAQVMSKGTILVSPNFNLGYYGGFDDDLYDGYGGFTPGGTVNVDIGVHDYVSVGPYVGFAGRNGFRNIAFGARGNFHFGQLIGDKKGVDLLTDKLDLYYYLGLGGRIATYKDLDKDFYSPFSFGFSSAVGARYYVADWIGVQAEFGITEMSFAKIGVTFKFGGDK